MTSSLVILTGASGAGKTTLAAQFLERYRAECDVFFFDSIGVPPVEKMEADYGSGEAWQRAMTMQWIARIHPILSAQRPVLLEGQMRISFIQEALTAYEITTAHIILVDCDDLTRTARLRVDRSQPELANPIMMNWALYLREEALRLGIEILDTSLKSLEDCIPHLKRCLFGENTGK
jgi:adenylate kinase family enzyme